MKFVRLVAALSRGHPDRVHERAGPPPSPPPPLAATYANADLAAGGPAADTGAWWHGFRDPILDRLVDTRSRTTSTCRRPVARIDAARAVRIGAASQWFPSVDLNAGAGRQRQSASQAVPDRYADDRQRVRPECEPRMGKSTSSAASARGCRQPTRIIASAQNDAAAVRIATIDETVRTYVTVRGLEQRLALVEANASSQRGHRGIDTAPVRRGRRADRRRRPPPPRRRKRRWPNCPRCQTAAAGRDSPAVESLPHRRRRISMRGSTRPRPSRCGPPARRASARRPTCCAGGPTCARPRRASSPAYARIGVAEADLKPHLQLIGVIGAAIDGFSGASLARSLVWMAGAGASAPLIDGGRRRSVVALRRAQADQALAAYRTAVLTAVGDVETSVAATARNHGRTERLERAVSNARGAYTQINRSWRSGESAFIDTLEVQRALLAAEDSARTGAHRGNAEPGQADECAGAVSARFGFDHARRATGSMSFEPVALLRGVNPCGRHRHQSMSPPAFNCALT
ncbi:TolC family protein [Burkholderia cenocepacia]|uniref:TolC family protein n=1 Tax=Burkholderia cenocepacia TaxID=95486 RepID=UPI001EF1D4D0|nr:TolC family protein [Burkholderia cenocepacia]